MVYFLFVAVYFFFFSYLLLYSRSCLAVSRIPSQVILGILQGCDVVPIMRMQLVCIDYLEVEGCACAIMDTAQLLVPWGAVALVVGETSKLSRRGNFVYSKV